ncbi:MAG: signal peptidase I [Anaerolineae bacterium]|nr:signal peptidase I [Anaerolineae bacterium]
MSFEVEQPAPEPIKPSRPGLSPRRGWLRDILEIMALVVIIYTLVNLSTARAIVEGPSMQPNFYTGQLVIVNRFAYYFSDPARGDVVVLNNPSDSCKDAIKNRSTIEVPLISHNNTSGACEDLIKRVVGLPGETVQIKEGRVYINDTLIDEPYIPTFCTVGCDGKWTLEPDQYFVLGDNRRNSYDSHSFGPINRHLIVGQAWIRYWPLPDAGVIPHPAYGPIANTHAATPSPAP